MPSVRQDFELRGLLHQVTDDELPARLDAGRLVVYAGFDPTASSLHLGSLLQLCTLRRLQLAGHRPIALVGGATGQIGDPGGKSEERPLHSREELAANVAGIREQVGRFVELAPANGADHANHADHADRDTGALVVDNVDWLGPMALLDFLRDVGKHFTVNQMVAKESVRARLERPDHGISFTEFSYMLLQAYDFLSLHRAHGCNVQFGGSDQWGNITMGVELVRKVCQAHVFGFTSPLVTKADGTKFGKTETGTIWLDPGRTSPFQLYQYLLQGEDATAGAYLRYFTFLSHEELAELDKATAEHPERRRAQRTLAHEVCTLVHGPAETAQAERASASLFTEDLRALDEATLLQVTADAPSTTVSRAELVGEGRSGPGGPGGRAGGLPLVDALVLGGLVGSKGEARRAVIQGGVYVNNARQEDPERRLAPADLLHDRYVVLRRGRRTVHLLRAG